VTAIAFIPEEMDAERERRARNQKFSEEAEELSRDLGKFIRAAWPFVLPHVRFISNWHIDAQAEHLEAVSKGEIRKLQVWVPPGSMKSISCSVMWPAWEWTFAPEIRYLTGSYDIDLSTEFAVRTRTLIQDPWYQARWGHVFQMKSDENAKRNYKNDHGGHRYATSPTGGGTGRHADRILIDDPLNAQEIVSDVKLEEAQNWYGGTLATRVGDYETFCEVIIMQRLHEKDLAQHALELSPGDWTILCLPEEYDPGHKFAWRKDPRKKKGELLWPARINQEAHEERKRKLGTHRAAGQLQQNPTAREGAILKRAHWRFYDPRWLDAAEAGDVSKFPKFTRVFTDWDTAFKDKTTSDYVAGGIWGVAGGNRYLLRMYHEQARLSRTKTLMKEARKWCLERWPHAAFSLVIEKAANGVEIIEELRQEIPGVIPYVASVDKTARAEAAEPDLESGNIFVPGYRMPDSGEVDPRSPAFSQILIEECAKFPGGEHDDLVDMFTMAINWVRTKGSGQGTSLRPAATTVVPAARRVR
jgi:predicted phage terminase large subunit-like protein